MRPLVPSEQEPLQCHALGWKSDTNTDGGEGPVLTKLPVFWRRDALASAVFRANLPPETPEGPVGGKGVCEENPRSNLLRLPDPSPEDPPRPGAGWPLATGAKWTINEN